MVSPAHREEVGRPVPRRGPGRDGRPQLTAAHAARPGPRQRWSSGSWRLRWRHRLGPGPDRRPARACRPRPCTRCWCAAGSTGSRRIDRVTGEPLRRYEHDHPGSLIHVDVTKFGNIPDGGGHRYVGRQQGERNRPSHRPTHRRARQATYRPADRHRVRAHRHRRPLPRRLRRDLRRREGRHRDRGPAPGRGLVRRPGRHRRTGPVRQRFGLPLLRLARRLRRAGHHPQADPALPAADQRQDRTLPPHPGRRMGLRPLLRLRPTNATSRPPRLAALLQSPPSPLRHRRPATDHPTDQRPWTSH